VIVFTVLETANANRLNPAAYLNHLLSVLPNGLLPILKRRLTI
jgi:hypothetical protein